MLLAFFFWLFWGGGRYEFLSLVTMTIPNLGSKTISLNIHVFFLDFYLQLQDKATLLTAERKKVGIYVQHLSSLILFTTRKIYNIVLAFPL